MNRYSIHSSNYFAGAVGRVFAVLLALGSALPALATTGHMGISVDTVLTENHTGTISLTAPGITLDCDGYTVQFGPDPVVVTSVVIFASLDGDTVKNCTVDADNATVASDAAIGIAAGGSANIVDNTVSGGWTQAGIQVNSAGAVISGNVVTGGTEAAHGFIFGGANLTASGNAATVNSTAGFRLSNLSNSTLTGNSAADTVFGNGFLLVGSDNNVLQGNSATGSAAHGFGVSDSLSNQLDSNAATGNTGNGISVNSGSNGNTFEGNTLSENGADGIGVGASDNNLITGNTITDNTRHGVTISTENGPADGNAILSNVISGHTGSTSGNPHLGIELVFLTFGTVTPNDPGDTDVGPNGLQNFPVLSPETSAGVNGTLDSTPNTTYTVEIFANAVCSDSRHGEGGILLGEAPVTTDATGHGSFTTSLAVPPGHSVSATATSPGGDTSEFSECMTDNCPDDFNPDQSDIDEDGLGDLCDVCPFDPENDGDSDGICESDPATGDPLDNCPSVANSGQSDIDMDGLGDACDNDIDGDNVLNQNDNCVFDANTDQTDTDSDGAGDACDSDLDGDGVIDADDACVPTPSGEVVDATGCAIVDLCPCEHAISGSMWKNHGAYVSCVAHAANDFVAAGLISETDKGDIVSAAGQSDCGHRNQN